MGQAVRKLKPPSPPVTPSEYAIPKVKRQSVDVKSAPPEPQIIIEPDRAEEGNRPDPNFVSMSQQIVGAITTRPAGQKEHPTCTITHPIDITLCLDDWDDLQSMQPIPFCRKARQERAAIKVEYSRPMPADRHTTLLSGPDEDSIQSPGTLNHAHIRELFLLHQGKADGQEKPFDVESLATKFNVDVGLLKRVLQYNTLVHFQKPVDSNTS